jgi:hypothetical protein
VTWVKSKVALVCLETVLILASDCSTVFTECTIGMQFILAIPDGTPRLRGQMEACFDPFGDSVNLDAT